MIDFHKRKPKKMNEPLRVFSFGAGQQSVAVLLLDIQGKIQPFDYYIFANVGDNAEHPDTLTYLKEVVYPLCEKYKKNIITVARMNRKNKPYDLYEETIGNNKTIPIPAYMQNGAPMLRNCTSQYKIAPVDKEVTRLSKIHGVEYVELGIGFDVSEKRRVNKKIQVWHNHTVTKAGNEANKTNFYKKFVFPLYELGLNRSECLSIIESFGIPVPRSSCCYFCPFQNNQSWYELRENTPELFEKAKHLEDRLNEKRELSGKDPISLHKKVAGKNLPLEVAVPSSVQALVETVLYEDNCDSGYCGL